MTFAPDPDFTILAYMTESHRYLVATVQMHAVEDKATNLQTATKLVEQAATEGARLVVLPEFFSSLGYLEAMVQQAEPIPGPTSEAMSALAARLEITLVAGTICEQSTESGKGHNTCLVFDPTGRQIACYRKMHLFDAEVPGEVSFQESQWIVPGEDVVTTETPLGTLGLAVCYDLRFPELFRALADQGTELIVFPSAFSAPTGLAHWEVLLRARAIEEQSFVIASNQYGQHTPNFSSYGHSMIVDPWGQVLAQAESDKDCVVLAEIDLQQVARVRRNLPALAHRRSIG